MVVESVWFVPGRRGCDVSLVGLVRDRYEQLASGAVGWGSLAGSGGLVGARDADDDKYKNWRIRLEYDSIYEDFSCDDYLLQCYRRCERRGGVAEAYCEKEQRGCECARPERWHGAP